MEVEKIKRKAGRPLKYVDGCKAHRKEVNKAYYDREFKNNVVKCNLCTCLINMHTKTRHENTARCKYYSELLRQQNLI